MKATNALAVIVTSAVLETGAVWAVPEVGSVTMTQRENSRIVDIGYTLAGEAAIITLAIETNGVAIPDGAVTRLSGDVCRVVQTGTRSIVWNAGEDWPEHMVTNARARVTAWQTNSPPLYCAVDLTGGSATDCYPVAYYSGAEALPYGGLTNAIYKSSYLVMRRITNGAFSMGEGTSPVAVTLTKGFYAGVFEVTQGQWYNVMGSSLSANFTDASSRAYRPMEKVSYDDVRGATNSFPVVDWPGTGVSVLSSSFVGLLRAKTGLAGFDLPTETQWEYACRAGTTTYFSDGDASANVNGANAKTNMWLDVLGRYKFDGGYVNGMDTPATYCSPANGTAIVGSYLPNAWGLYDTHGNVWEWCLDWPGTLAGGTDPEGADSGSRRAMRGGSWNYNASDCRSAGRRDFFPSYRDSAIGFRLFRTLP